MAEIKSNKILKVFQQRLKNWEECVESIINSSAKSCTHLKTPASRKLFTPIEKPCIFTQSQLIVWECKWEVVF